MKLYEIKEAMVETLDIFLESEREEIDNDFYLETMEYLKAELTNKSSKIIKYASNVESEVASIKSDVIRLKKLQKARESKLENLKNYLVNTMQSLDKTKIETDLGSYGIRKSTSLKVIDMNKIPEEYLKVKEEITIDKRELTTLIKSGKNIAGVTLIENYSLNIK